MRYRPLGPTGTKVSTISLGSWLTFGTSVEQDTTEQCVRVAFDHGINFFDTADIYNRGAAEIALGKALRPLKRSDYVLATKCFWPMSDNVNDRGLSRKHIFESVHASLERLQVDYLDLYQCHRFDPETPVEEVVRAMEDLIRQGKLLHWGVSCWTAAQITHACTLADRLNAYRPVTNQPPYNLVQREIEDEVIPTSSQFAVRQIVFSPLAQGLLTGKYNDGKIPEDSRAADERRGQFLRPRLTEDNFQVARALGDLAAEAQTTTAALALAWTLRNEDVASAIVGATRVEQLEENVTAADLSVDDELMNRVDRLTRQEEA